MMQIQSSSVSTSASQSFNVKAWDEISDIISSSETNTSYKPTPAEPSLMLPNTFANVVNKRHVAFETSLKSKKECSKEVTKVPKFSAHLVADVLFFLKQLRAHYERLLAEPSRFCNYLAGFDPHNTIWVSPSAQPDFLSFIDVLWARWGSSAYPRNEIEHLLEWAVKPPIDKELVEADIDSSASTYQTLDKAFQTFRFALEDMINKHRDSITTD